MPQNDTKKLAEAKALVYLKGFTDGVLVVGEHAGKKVRAGRGREGRWWGGGGAPSRGELWLQQQRSLHLAFVCV